MMIRPSPNAIPAEAMCTTGFAQEDAERFAVLILFAIRLVILPFVLIGNKGSIIDAHKSPHEYLLLQNE